MEDYINKILNSKLPNIEQMLICCLLRNGLRISEIADTSKITIVSNCKLSIYEYKTGQSRIVPVFEHQKLLSDLLTMSNRIYWSRNRFYYYRIFKQMGIAFQSENNIKQSVTHAARHIVAEEIMNATNDIQQVQKALGHKSVNSTSHYISNDKKRAKQKKGIIETPTGELPPIKVNKKGVITLIRK